MPPESARGKGGGGGAKVVQKTVQATEGRRVDGGGEEEEMVGRGHWAWHCRHWRRTVGLGLRYDCLCGSLYACDRSLLTLTLGLF
jgi:hypothetical protein